MPGTQSQSLNARSSIAMLLRTLYRKRLDYCVLPPADAFADIIVFAKDQLVSLIERIGPEMLISEIVKLVTEGSLRPIAIFKPDALSQPDALSHALSKAGFTDPEELQVLRIDDNGSDVMRMDEAIRPNGPDFPEWWEAPVPFAMYGKEKLHINRTAELMFGSDLKRLSASDLPDKNEFLVALESSTTPCSVTFRRLEGDIFMLDDSTSDIMAAADIAWWAAVGKAWLSKLDREKCRYRRFEQMSEAKLAGLRENSLVLPCEWEGELLGYLCIEKSETGAAAQVKKNAERPKEHSSVPNAPNAAKKAGNGTQKPASRPPEKPAEHEPRRDEALNALGPQALGLLVPTSRFADVSGKPGAQPAEFDDAAKAAAEERRRAKAQKRPGKPVKKTGSDG